MDVSFDYDLVVLGSGPAGQKAAIQAAKLGRRVALVERRHMVGGVCTNTGTIPSKTLREAVVYLTGMAQREVYGSAYRVKDEITVSDLFARTHHVIDREIDVVRNQLTRNHVQLLTGEGRFVDPHTVAISRGEGEERRITGANFVIAVGTTPNRPKDVAFDERTILDSDGILQLDRIPTSMVVVGAGVVGIEYASMFAALGTRVTVIEQRQRLLGVLRRPDRGGAAVPPARPRRDVPLRRVRRGRRSARRLDRHRARQRQAHPRRGGALLRRPAGRDRGPGPARRPGIAADRRGRIEVGPGYRTNVEHIYAAGDVIGFPSARRDVHGAGAPGGVHAFGVASRTIERPAAVGIYTIPEISMVGRTEEELTEASGPLRDRHRPLRASWPAARSSATSTGC